MQTRRTLTVGFFVATMMALGAGPARAVTSAGPYYAEPSWDQKLQCDTQATCPRFIVLSNWADTSHPSGGAAVLDRETGLVWEQSPDTTFHTWSDARLQCTSRPVGGRKGWRLPSVHELMSLVDPNNVDPTSVKPALPPGHPFTVVSASYWSATTSVDDPANVWIVHVSTGGVTAEHKSGDLRMWCVRGAMNADQY